MRLRPAVPWFRLAPFYPTNPVAGAASSTDNAIARWDGTTGTVLQNSTVTVEDDGTLALYNSASEPGAVTDRVKLYAADLSAGNATLGIRTETAVAADVAIASTHSLSVRINGATYKVPLTSV